MPINKFGTLIVTDELRDAIATQAGRELFDLSVYVEAYDAATRGSKVISRTVYEGILAIESESGAARG